MHCQICNYSQTEGSDLLDTPPNHFNQVRYFKPWEGWFCTECVNEVISLIIEDQIDEVIEDTPSVS